MLGLAVILTALSAAFGCETFLRMCYFTTWSRYRAKPANILPTDVDPALCTHIIVAFGTVSDEGEFGFVDSAADKRLLDDLKKLMIMNPDLKIMYSLGGVNFPSETWRNVSSSQGSLSKFAKSVIDFISQQEISGFDFAWSAPEESDKDSVVAILSAIKDAAKNRSVEVFLSVSMPRLPRLAKGYEPSLLAALVDACIINTYGYASINDGVTGHNAPLLGQGDNVANSIDLWLAKGVDTSKLIVGIPSYGIAYSLKSVGDNMLGSETTGGIPGDFTRTKEFNAYYEICKFLQLSETVIERDEDAKAPFAYNGKAWMSYDDIQSIKEKVTYFRCLCLGGFALWTIDMDDFFSACGSTFPLAKAAKSAQCAPVV